MNSLDLYNLIGSASCMPVCMHVLDPPLAVSRPELPVQCCEENGPAQLNSLIYILVVHILVVQH